MILFYDGHCGLCHGAVLFILKRDRKAEFQFAPLQGDTFRSSGFSGPIPDSMILQMPDGSRRAESDAWVQILRKLGGGWRILGAMLNIIPPPLRDAGYRLIARLRHRIYGRREELCPMIPAELRPRFRP